MIRSFQAYKNLCGGHISKSGFKSSIGSSILSRQMSLEQKVEANGINFNYVKVGNGEQVVLLLPGALGSTQTDFLPQIKSMDKEKFTVISLDFRGYGSSIPPKRDFPVDFYKRDADDALEVMQKLGYKKYSILGWSDGGNCACIMASLSPQSIKKLVLWGGNSFITPEELVSYQSIRNIDLWSAKMKQPMVDIYGIDYFESMWHQWVDVFSTMEKDEKGIINLYRESLKNIEAETLIIHGMKDRLVPLFQSEYLKENVKNSRLIIWDDGSHNLHLRFHERFKKLVESFLLGNNADDDGVQSRL